MSVVDRDRREPLREKMLQPEAMSQPGRRTLRFRERPFDMAIVGFFCVNLFLVTYFVDIGQLTIADPYHFSYPLWPPHFFVNMVLALNLPWLATPVVVATRMMLRAHPFSRAVVASDGDTSTRERS